jgi:hypothetical protein
MGAAERQARQFEFHSLGHPMPAKTLIINIIIILFALVIRSKKIPVFTVT